jgi:hypothetical protein
MVSNSKKLTTPYVFYHLSKHYNSQPILTQDMITEMQKYSHKTTKSMQLYETHNNVQQFFK